MLGIKTGYKNGVTLRAGQSDNTVSSGIQKKEGELGERLSLVWEHAERIRLNV